MNGSGFNGVFEDEGTGFQVGDSSEAYFGGSASTFVIVYALSFADSGDGLAREASNVEINGGVVGYSGLGPGILSDFKGLEIVPYEFSGVGFEFRGADEQVWDAERVEGL